MSVLSSVSGDDARRGRLDRNAAFLVLDGCAGDCESVLRAEAVTPTPGDEARKDVLAAVRRRKTATAK